MPTLHEIVVRPVVTEKSSAAYQTRGEYTFEVHPEANKYQIRQAIEKLFGVKVTDVWTMQMRRGKVTPRSARRGTHARAGRRRSSRSRTATRSTSSRAEMSIRQFQPVTAGTRFRSVSGFRRDHAGHAGEVAARAAEEVGRPQQPRPHRRSRHRGGGHKRKYRIIDFKRNKFGIPATGRGDRVRSEPHRAHRAGRVRGRREALHPAPEGAGQSATRSISGPGSDSRDRQRAAAAARSRSAPTVHNVELKIGQGRPDGPLGRHRAPRWWRRKASTSRSACRSTEMRLVHGRCLATIGEVGNAEHELLSVGKAGKSRWLGKRPKVRGEVDEPGRSPARRPYARRAATSSSPWGKQGRREDAQQEEAVAAS